MTTIQFVKQYHAFKKTQLFCHQNTNALFLQRLRYKSTPIGFHSKFNNTNQQTKGKKNQIQNWNFILDLKIVDKTIFLLNNEIN